MKEKCETILKHVKTESLSEKCGWWKTRRYGKIKKCERICG